MFLLTGATGFVGKGMQEALRQRGIAFRAAGRHAYPGLFPVGEINGHTDWSAATSGINVVFHLASVNQNVIEGDPAALQTYRAVNVDGTLNLARQAAAAGVKRFVFVSTIKANGEWTTDGQPFKAGEAPNPQTDYAATKLEAEQGLHALSGQTGMEVVVIRSPLVYGRHMRGSFNALVSLVQRGLPLPLRSIRNKRSMVYLGNLIDLIILAGGHPAAAGGTFLAGDGESPSTPELLRLIGSTVGSPVRLLPCPGFLLEVAGRALGKQELVYRLTRSLEVDIDATRSRLGWTPPFGMSEGLALALDSRVPSRT